MLPGKTCVGIELVRRLIEAEWRQALENLWSHSISGAAVIDSHGKFLAANPAFCSTVEYTEAELLSKRWQDITHPEDLHASEEMEKQLVNDQVFDYSIRKRYLTKTGRVVWVFIKVVRVQNDDQAYIFHMKHTSEIPTWVVNPPPQIQVLPKKKFIHIDWSILLRYWPIVTTVLTASAILIAEILKYFTGKGSNPSG